MGFKRTSEGRIFFQSPEDGAGSQKGDQDNYDFEKPLNLTQKAPPITENPPNMKPKMKPAAQQNAPHTQMQIVTLLKTLNERLKITQAERNKMAKELSSYRAMIEGLQEKSDFNEKAYRALSQKIAQGGTGAGGHAETLARDALEELEETRKLLLSLETKATRADTGVKVLKKLQTEQAEKMAVSVNHAAAMTKRLKDTEERQEQIGARVDDTIGQQARLTRKIDKAIEERARFTRKLERIEEAVLQTRDSLNAKAMVLLTDQGVTAQAGVEDAQETAYAPGQFQTDPYAAQKAGAGNQSETLQMVGVGLLVTAALLGGWLLNAYQKPAMQSPDVAQATIESTSTQLSSNDRQDAPTDIAEMEWSIVEDTSSFSQHGAAKSPAAQQPQTHGDDIGALDLNNQAQVEALLSENPDAVAAALNEIEPANPLPKKIIAPEPVKQASVSPKVKTAAPVKKLKPLNPKDPKTLAKPDSALPDVVKNIEEQAFEGVADAQHDLAAIYTAGHGGVKQDYKRAAFWFEQAASRGVANAAYNLGVLNHQGLGGAANLEKAIEWYNRAASLGHPEAQYNLGIAYIEGIGVPYDAEKAAKYFKSAAQNNIMEAAYNLGLIYENGLLGDAEPDKALVWYKTAADQGSPEAKQALEQLAETLNISVDDVNGLADSMKILEKSETTTATTTTAQASISNNQIITAQVQEYLMRMGLYPGPADGITGPLTQDAVRSYQRLHNLSLDGGASEALLSHMLANAGSEESALDQGSRAQ